MPESPGGASARPGFVAFLWWKPGVDPELARLYWRDIHGTMATWAVWKAVPGADPDTASQLVVSDMGQLHPQQARVNPFSPVDGIKFSWPEEKQPGCVIWAYYPTEEAYRMFKALIESFPEAPPENDNAFLTERYAQYWSAARTYAAQAIPPGSVAKPTFSVWFRRRESTSRKAFQHYMHELADRWSTTEGVIAVRRWEVENPVWQDPQSRPIPVPPGQQWEAVVDLTVADEETASGLFDDALDHAAHLSAVSTLRIMEQYEFIRGGKPTNVGIRGYPLVKLIDDVGATYQNDPAVLKFVYDKDVAPD